MKKRVVKFVKSTRDKIRRYFGVTFDERKVLIFAAVFVGAFLIILAAGFAIFKDRGDFYVEPKLFDYGEIKGDIFADVSDDHPNVYALAYLKSYGIIQGYDDNSFHPDEPMTRAAFMKMLTGAFRKHPHKLHYSSCYSDVTNEWFASYVCYGKVQGWLEGVGTVEGEEELFMPEKNITRADALRILMQAFEIEPFHLEDSSVQPNFDELALKYNDVVFEDWYIPYLLIAEENKWFVGLVDENQFGADKEMTRAEIGELLFRVIVTTLPVY